MNVSEIQFSEMVNGFKTGIFATLNEKKEELIKEGRKVYNLSVGTPDFKPAPHVMKAKILKIISMHWRISLSF